MGSPIGGNLVVLLRTKVLINPKNIIVLQDTLQKEGSDGCPYLTRGLESLIANDSLNIDIVKSAS